MKAAFLFAIALGAVAVPAAAKGEDPAAMLNRAAALAEQGDYAAARALYRQVIAAPADFKLETNQGTWAYPAEIARRGLLAIERRDQQTLIASSQ
ncbi:hypothetical protein LY632_11075 [Erythrobacter sp. SDW2]|uniref:hypothetical protein n=1 Tax=Erythrobacter sp. SDW2 TaxID=2907154 RepID=UPI001F3FA32B|nr:hypothetical protein [Erythrobacter sp. SDW2]UIP06229.1 hypothetical protein LY632_11075 [Erythrobacter sp. SDW2]